jgi:hypothetical protein
LACCSAARTRGSRPGQRYHFIAGWLPWIADGLNLLMNCTALVWTLVMVTFPRNIEPPLMIFSVLPLSLFVFKLVKLLHLYRTRVGATFVQTISAAIAGLSLSHTIGAAMVSGLFRKDKPFFRTPKLAKKHAFAQAFGAAREELFMMLGFWFAAVGASQIPNIDGDDLTLIASPDSEHLGGRAADPVDTVCGGGVRLADQHPGRFRRVDRRDGFAPAGSGHRAGFGYRGGAADSRDRARTGARRVVSRPAGAGRRIPRLARNGHSGRAAPRTACRGCRWT